MCLVNGFGISSHCWGFPLPRRCVQIQRSVPCKAAGVGLVQPNITGDKQNGIQHARMAPGGPVLAGHHPDAAPCLGAGGQQLSEQAHPHHRTFHGWRHHRHAGTQHRAKDDRDLGPTRGGGKPSRCRRLAGHRGHVPHAVRWPRHRYHDLQHHLREVALHQSALQHGEGLCACVHDLAFSDRSGGVAQLRGERSEGFCRTGSKQPRQAQLRVIWSGHHRPHLRRDAQAQRRTGHGACALQRRCTGGK